ncbi:hypothetical protein ACQ4M3_41440 [Leptolyngbya sp. AN03gr2]|uniref:hypothetical protein n=1 Tax=unclassified Leptolyngbya TaxID=2650499 RepID=UPI003D321644
MISNSPQDPQDPSVVPPNTNEKTPPMSDSLDPVRDHAQFLEMIRAEEASDGEVGVGRDWGTELVAFFQDPEGMESLAQLRDWMLKEFRLMLIEWDLGVAIDAIYPNARKLIIQRFRQLSISMQDRLWQLFEQMKAGRTDKSQATVAAARAANREVCRIMVQTLTEEDWRILIQSATSTLKQYLHHKRVELSSDDTPNEAGAED